jgi:hypothetical protein
MRLQDSICPKQGAKGRWSITYAVSLLIWPSGGVVALGNYCEVAADESIRLSQCKFLPVRRFSRPKRFGL